MAKYVTNVTICIWFNWTSIALFQHHSCSPLPPMKRQPSSPQYQKIPSLHTFYMRTTEVESGRTSYPLDGSLTRLGRTTPIPLAKTVFSSYTPNSQVKLDMLSRVHGRMAHLGPLDIWVKFLPIAAAHKLALYSNIVPQLKRLQFPFFSNL